jgi:CrcB protein
MKLILTIGAGSFIGGFTTFSAFSIETFALLKDGNTGYALLYIFASVLLGLLATYVAWLLVKHL